MIFVNEATKRRGVPATLLDGFLRLLAPFAPHLAEELWASLGHSDTIAFAAWPDFDPAKCLDESVCMVVQVDGKVRGLVTVPCGTSEQGAQAAARKDSAIARYLDNRKVVRDILRSGPTVNIITS